ncbi:MAG: hypothetical protein EOP05_17275 [Proteobacteria bacterium]|nr:MAG: hypothetical protein EOP05_17275 [Pseudomonadota bacterium]
MRERLSALLTCVLAASVLAACSPTTSSVQDVNPVNTGTLESESQYGALNLSQVTKGQQVYVASQELRMRTSPEVREDNIAHSAHMNDKLEIVNPTAVGSNKFIQVRVLESTDKSLIGKTLYTSADYLDSKPAQQMSKSTERRSASSRIQRSTWCVRLVHGHGRSKPAWSVDARNYRLGRG